MTKGDQKIREAAHVAKDVIAQAASVAATMVKEAKQVNAENVAVIAVDIGYIKRDVGEIKEKLDRDYVSKDEFSPVRNIVYGLVGILGIATLGAILRLVLI